MEDDRIFQFTVKAALLFLMRVNSPVKKFTPSGEWHCSACGRFSRADCAEKADHVEGCTYVGICKSLSS